MQLTIFLLIIIVTIIKQVENHGMMLEPPNRSSLWRYDKNAPVNYDDNQNYCGGFHAQWEMNNGSCGVCGDPVYAPHPQDNENTGKYGQGKIVRQYKSGSVITVYIKLTANHLGHFQYSLCNLINPKRPEPGEKCFQLLKLSSGDTEFPVTSIDFSIYNKVKLPNGLKCKRCVLRWTYSGGNNWGLCNNGTEAIGCGPQETFRSCSDISIL